MDISKYGDINPQILQKVQARSTGNSDEDSDEGLQ